MSRPTQPPGERLRRLARQCNALRHVDSRSYPIICYSAGEVQPQRDKHNKVIVDLQGHVMTETVSLPIFPDAKTGVQGLRFGITKSIYSLRQELVDEGLQRGADQIIDCRRMFPKRGVVYEH